MIIDNGIILNYCIDGNKYVNVFYSLKSHLIFQIEDRNCGFPVVYKKDWYYIVVDSNNENTSIVKLDIQNRNKKIIFSKSSLNTYINGLYTDGQDLYVSIIEDGITQMFRIDSSTKYLIPIFRSEWVETVSVSRGFMTWLGASMINVRSRPEYFIFDLNNKILYQNNGGPIFLSDLGLVWIKYKRNDNQIAKGELYKNSNTSIVFVEWSTGE